MLIAIQNFHTDWQKWDVKEADAPSDSPSAIREAAGFTRDYYYHVLNSAIRDFGAEPMKFPFSRAVGLQLRAMRRWTDRGRAPTAEEQRACAGSFAGLVRDYVERRGSTE